MNILLINHYAGSLRHGMEYRPYYLAREWSKLGHDVTILAASESHVRSVSPHFAGRLTEEMIDGVRYLWVKTPPYAGNGAARAINIFAFVAQLLFHQTLLARAIKPDVVIASSTYPLDILAAKAISRISRAKLVFEVHDLWPLSPIELGGMSKFHPFIIVMQWAENFAYRAANVVVSMLPAAMEHMIQHGMHPEKFVYIPNGIDAEEWNGNFAPLPEEHARLISAEKLKGNFIVCYAGSHGLANSLQYFVDAAQQMPQSPVTFMLVGQGPEKESLVRLARSRNQKNVVFLPPVKKEAIPALLGAMDALYIGLKGDPLFRFGVSPNKLLDYMMSGKPVISAIRAGNDMVKESGCGFSIPPEDSNAIAQAVLRLMETPEQEKAEMGRRGRNYVLAHHEYRVLARRFLESLERQNHIA